MDRFLFAVLCFFLLVCVPFSDAQAQRAVPDSSAQITLSFAPLVRQVAPAVVSISATRTVTTRARNPFMDDPFFAPFFGRDFFGGGLSRQRIESALGSGVIVQSDGLVVTNAHVVRGAEDVTVQLADGREFPARIVLRDDPSDLALLRIDSADIPLPFADIRESDSLETGDLVIAIGNPFGVGQTVTSGIVSALARPNLNINDFNFFIQTDAAINPGNSGGPLVAMDGTVVGINTAIYSRSGGSLGIGFAIPSEMVAVVLAAEKSGQTGDRGVLRAWLGITAQDMTADLAASFGLDRPQGVLVANLHSQSPARTAGLRQGDVVLEVDGRAVRNPAEMKFRWAMVPLGGDSTFTYLRKGKRETVVVKAIRPPDSPPRTETLLEGNHPLSGATIAYANPAVAFELGLPESDEGQIVVLNVAPRSAAARIVSPGTVLVRVNDQEITDVKDVMRALTPARGSGFNLVLRSGGQTRQIMIR